MKRASSVRPATLFLAMWLPGIAVITAAVVEGFWLDPRLSNELVAAVAAWGALLAAGPLVYTILRDEK